MVHLLGSTFTEFVSGGVEFGREDEATDDLLSSGPTQVNDTPASGYYTSSFTGPRDKVKCKSPVRIHHISLSDDNESDSEIQVVDCKVKKNQNSHSKDDLHVLSQINPVLADDSIQIIDNDVQIIDNDVQIIDDDDCSIINSTVAISKGNIAPTPVLTPILAPVPQQQHHWCILCRGYFSDDKENHEKSIAHRISVNHAAPLPKLPPSSNYTIPPSNIGYKMLLSQGWDQSKGLGKNGQGPKCPVKTVLKLDRSGLGNGSQAARVSHWCWGASGRSVGNKMGKQMQYGKSSALLASKQKEFDIRREIYNF